MKAKSVVVLSALALAFACASVPVFAMQNGTHSQTNPVSAASNTNVSAPNPATNPASSAPDTAPSAPKATAQPLSKDDVYEKMLNAVDYYSSAKGVLRTTFYDSSAETTIAYTVNTHGDYSETITNAAPSAPCDIHSYKVDGSITRFDCLRRTYTEQGACELMPIDTKPSARITTHADGSTVYNYRPELNTLSASMSLLPQQIAFGLLADETAWDVTGTEEYVGYSCTKIGGSTGEYGKKFGATQFMALMDDATGILLKLEMYNDAGKTVQFLDTDSIQIHLDGTTETIDIPRGNYEGYSHST